MLRSYFRARRGGGYARLLPRIPSMSTRAFSCTPDARCRCQDTSAHATAARRQQRGSILRQTCRRPCCQRNAFATPVSVLKTCTMRYVADAAAGAQPARHDAVHAPNRRFRSRRRVYVARCCPCEIRARARRRVAARAMMFMFIFNGFAPRLMQRHAPRRRRRDMTRDVVTTLRRHAIFANVASGADANAKSVRCDINHLFFSSACQLDTCTSSAPDARRRQARINRHQTWRDGNTPPIAQPRVPEYHATPLPCQAGRSSRTHVTQAPAKNTGACAIQFPAC